MRPRNRAAQALRTLRPKRTLDRKKVIPRKTKHKAPKRGPFSLRLCKFSGKTKRERTL